MSARSRTQYVFGSIEQTERDRLDGQSRLWDAFTFRRLESTGVGPGWHCLEIGAGTGTVARWLARRVAPRGRVVATDIETRWLQPITASNLEVRHHNVLDDPLEHHGYDLVHTRLLLEHLPQRTAVLRKLVSAVRPGGYLVVEDYDIRSMQLTDAAGDDWTAVNEAVIDTMGDAGADLTCGQRLTRLMTDAGLEAIDAEGLVYPMTVPELAPVFRTALERIAPMLIGTHAVTPSRLDRVLSQFDLLDDPPIAYSPILVSVRGKRPYES